MIFEQQTEHHLPNQVVTQLEETILPVLRHHFAKVRAVEKQDRVGTTETMLMTVAVLS